MNHRFVDEPIPGYPKVHDSGDAAADPRGLEIVKPKPPAPTELEVIPWADPVLDRLGQDPRGPYVERFWVSVLGPTSTLLLRRLAQGLEANPDGFSLDPNAWAVELGVGTKGGKHGPFWRSVDRCCRFGVATRNGSTLAVRTKLPQLTIRQIQRLPAHLQAAHAAWNYPDAA